MKSDGPWRVILLLFGAGNLANGIWMLVSPGHWYINLPANVPGTGPLNEHFVRDIGCIFALVGIALVISAFRPKFRTAALLFATGFNLAHALVHVFDSARGLLPDGQWRYDAFPVYGTTAILLLLTWVWTRAGQRAV